MLSVIMPIPNFFEATEEDCIFIAKSVHANSKGLKLSTVTVWWRRDVERNQDQAFDRSRWVHATQFIADVCYKLRCRFGSLLGRRQ